ncbi:MAG: hypothetical protein U0744_02445 [Gemmataceae bacterium]
MFNESKPSLANWLDEKAAAIQKRLRGVSWSEGHAIGQSVTIDPKGWEVCVTAHSIADMRRIAAEVAAAEAEVEKVAGVSAMGARILAVLNGPPMTLEAIADAIGAEAGRYVQREIRKLWRAGKVSEHVDGYLRHIA